ncbi:MAG: Ig-like domain-containing protein, partial [Methanomassiliicoccaceae archaeon]|nr:Ig-like domain-containing protein [Methanomassiliicoccaceae archaeon]
YSLDAATWQPSETFSGLDPGTGYTFYARLAETATHNASPASAGTAVTTDKASLDGVVTITGTAQFGETLTADTGALETNVTGYLDFGTLSYEWKRGAAVVGTNAATYVLTAADVGQTITVTVTASNCDGSVASAATSSVSAVAITDAAIAVTAPVTGATPGTTATGTGNFTVSAVSWTPSDTIFLGGTVYEVTVVLDAAAGYTFAGSATATVNGDAAVIGSNTGTSLTLSYEFAATGTADVTGVDVISQPSKLTYTHGEALELAGFSVKVSYSDGTDDTVPFAQFTAKGISVSIADGTTLSRDTHNGTAVEVSCGTFSAFTDALIVSKAAYTPAAPTASGSFVYGTELSEWDLSADVRGTWSWADGSMIPDVTNGGYEAVFVLTDDNYTLASGGTATVSVTVTRAAVDITAVQGVTVPALGGTPVAFVTETDQYTGTVAWDPVVAVTFGPSTVYTATITLTAKDNYTFTGVAADMFTIFGAVCANAADGNVITAVFPETGDVLDTTPPEIVSVTPSGSDVALSGTIVITFDKPMDQTVGTVALDNGIGALTGGTWTSATSYSVPFGGLAEGTSYTVTASGFRDASGNGMTDNSEYGFATVAPEPRDDGGNGTDGGDDTGDDNILLYIVIIAAIAIVALVAVYLLLIRKP